jgi:hypothetical protein
MNRQIPDFLVFLGLLLVSGNTLAAPPYAGKKVLFIDSYHEGYAWSDGITEGVKSVLVPKIMKEVAAEETKATTGIELKILRMDTKRNDAEEFKQMAAIKAKAEIESFKPDVVIACDDNASKYLVAPFYKDADLPFVFCGVNWDVSAYGYPYKNVTGMIEVDLAEQILKHLKTYAKGERIGFIGTDNETDRKIMENYNKTLGIDFAQTYFASDFSTWKQGFSRAQTEVDMLITGGHIGISGWDDEEAKAFVETHIKIPVGTPNDWEMPYAVIGITRVPQEQGIWSAQTALKILDGASPAQIPIVTNEQGHLMLNLRLADKLDIAFKPGMLRLAEIIR